MNSMTLAVIGQLDSLLDAVEQPVETILQSITQATRMIESFSSFMGGHLSRVLLDPSVVIDVADLNEKLEILMEKLRSLGVLEKSKISSECLLAFQECVRATEEEVEEMKAILKTLGTGKWKDQIMAEKVILNEESLLT